MKQRGQGRRKRRESFSVGRMLVDYLFLLRSLAKYRYTCGARGLQDPFFPPFLLSFSCLLCSSLPCFTSLYFTLSLSSPFSSLLRISLWPSLACLALPCHALSSYPINRATRKQISIRCNQISNNRTICKHTYTHTHTYIYAVDSSLTHRCNFNYVVLVIFSKLVEQIVVRCDRE